MDEVASLILADVHFSLFGLGDTSYDKYNYAGKLLHRRMLALGATPLLEPAYGDERAPDGIEEALVPWLENIVDVMSEWLEVVPGKAELGSYDLDDPIYSIEWEESEDPARVTNGVEHLSLNGHDTPEQAQGHSAAAPGRQEDVKRGTASAHSKPKDWVWARLTRNERVTAADWYQDVREIELEFEDTDL